MTSTEKLAFIARAAQAAEYFMSQGRLPAAMTFGAIAEVAQKTSQRRRYASKHAAFVALDELIEDWRRETSPLN